MTAAHISSGADYQMCCGILHCSNQTEIVRCVVCQFFAYCKDHRGTRHLCMQAAQNQGTRLPELSKLLVLFKNLRIGHDDRLVHHVRIDIGNLSPLKTEAPSLGLDKWERRLSQLIQYVSQHTLHQAKKNPPIPTLLVEFTARRNEPVYSTTVLMRLFPTKRESPLLTREPSPARKPCSEDKLLMPSPIEEHKEEARAAEGPPDDFQLVEAVDIPRTIPRGMSDKIHGKPFWSYGGCLICGGHDSAVTACQKCDLLMHSECAPKHQSKCRLIRKPDEGSCVPAWQIANYLCTQEMGGYPVLYAVLSSSEWLFLNVDQICEAIKGPFGQRVASMVSAFGPDLNQHLIVAVDGNPTQQKVMVLTRVGKESPYCVVM